MLQEGNASRERLNEFNDLIYCFILYTVYTLFTFDENLHTDIFSLSGDGEQTMFLWILIVRTPDSGPDHNIVKTGLQGVG